MLQQEALFLRGMGGYHTYRIPALAVTNSGVLLAFCEGRKDSGADHGDIDLLLKRSFDGGVTWQETQLIYDAGPDTAGNPAPVVDAITGVVHLTFCINNRTVWVTESADDGATWSVAREITSSVKNPEYSWYGTGPCHGIQLSNGRLLIPCYQTRHVHVIYSDDHGATWRRGGTLSGPTGEPVALELVGGSVYMNCRNQQWSDRTDRTFAVSIDGGESFADTQWDAALIEPPCQASMARFTTEQQNGRNRVLFCNPASVGTREHLTVRLSYDECRTWTVAKELHAGPSAYSDICVLPDQTICCVYECGIARPYETLTLARFDVAWLTDDQDQL